VLHCLRNFVHLIYIKSAQNRCRNGKLTSHLMIPFSLLEDANAENNKKVFKDGLLISGRDDSSD